VHPNIHRSPGGTTHEFTWDHPRRRFFRDNGEYYGPEKAENGAIGPVTTRGSKPNASREAASKREGRQLEKRRGEGKCSKLPDMPLDILYGVSPRFNPVTDDGIPDDTWQSHMFTFVPPTDLLLVPWTNKAVGNVLAKESPRHAWIASVDNITVSQRLPECLAQLIRKSGSVHRRRCVKPRGAVEQDTLKIHSNERSWPGLT